MITVDKERFKEVEALTKKKFSHAGLAHKAVKELFRMRMRQELKQLEDDADGKQDKTKRDQIDLIAQDISEIPQKGIRPHDLLKMKINLPSLPKIFSQIVEVMSNPLSSSKHFSDVIRKDPALSAKILKLANSAFYGYRSKIDTITTAVTIIGTNELYALALSMSVMKMFKNIPTALVDMSSFWKHSIAVGIIARQIADYRQYSDKERFFIAGLLHDIGRLIIYQYLPSDAKNALIHARQKRDLLYKSEKEVLGFNHARIGGMLLSKWDLPEELGNMVRFHHNPEKAKEDITEASVIHLSDIMANVLRHGTSGEFFIPPLNKVSWENIGLEESAFTEILKQSEIHINEVTEILLVDNKS